MAGKFQKWSADYEIMAPEDMDELLFSPFEIALGEVTAERIKMQYDNYEYYDGKQHRNENGELVKASELERPPGLEYDPTRYATNYFKAIINRKARWQMGGKHNIVVPRHQIDEPAAALEPGYEPSSQQLSANELSEGYEDLLKQLWNENKMRAKLIQAARDRLVADRVVCKIVFNPNTGKLRWVFRPDTEFIPVYSDDDFEELIACHFIRQKIVDVDDEEVEAFQKQTFTLEGEGENRKCYIEEGVYLAEDLSLFEQVMPKTTMEIPFIPVVVFEVNDLLAETAAQSEVSDLREQNDVLNQMNADAIDSLKFEMFSMTAVLNAPEGTAEQMQIAPGAVLEARGYQDGKSPSIQKVESGFKWGSVFKDQYSRVKGAMHEVSGLPQIIPQELNFGGLNGDALQVLFHDIISDTEEHWLSWEYGIQELHEKSVKYLQARMGESMFVYEKDVVRKIEDYTTEMKFTLPLPDNRKELVALLGEELAIQLESQKGAMERLGVDDIKAKQQEIANELAQQQEQEMLYGEGAEAAADPSGKPKTDKAKISTNEDGKKVNEKGEEVKECPVCQGSGEVIDKATGEFAICDNCRGDGVIQVRKR